MERLLAGEVVEEHVTLAGEVTLTFGDERRWRA
jgi:hypothetical protein